jgi:hypothetical protein
MSRRPLVTACAALALVALSLPAWPQSGPPGLIAYQARVCDAAGAPITGARHAKFLFYDSLTAGTLLLTYVRTGAQVVSINDALMTVQLGDTTAGAIVAGTETTMAGVFKNRAAVYLELQLSTDNVTFEALSPRVRVTSSGYAQNAGALSGKLSTDFLDTSATAQTKSGNLTVSGVLSGNGSGLTTLNANNISSGTLPIARGGTGATAFTSGAVVYANGSALSGDAASFKWDATNKRLGLGLSSPAVTLDVNAGSGATALKCALSNTGTTPIVDLVQSNTGDAALRFALGTTTSWALGADNSDSDKFKVSYAASGSAALGTNDRLILDSIGNLTVLGGTDTVMQVQGSGTVQLRLYDSGGPSNAKYCALRADGGDYLFRQLNDDLTLKRDAMAIKATGLVGIGTTAPAALLDISGDGQTVLLPRKSTAGDPTGVNAMVYYNSSSSTFRAYEGGAWKNLIGGSGGGYWTASGANIYNNNTGNVGIGLSNPAFKLHVSSSAAYNNDGTGAFAISDSTTVAKKLFMGFDPTADVGFISAVHTGVANKNIVFPTGNIGLGAMNPSEKLEISGNIKFVSSVPVIITPNNTALVFAQAGGARASLDSAGIDVGLGGTAGYGIINSSPTYNLHLQVGGSDKMTILNSGNIGIGTTTPSALLDITGDGKSIILPRKSSSGDPTGANGMLYYNAASSAFRAYENGSWKNVISSSTTKPNNEFTLLEEWTTIRTDHVGDNAWGYNNDLLIIRNGNIYGNSNHIGILRFYYAPSNSTFGACVFKGDSSNSKLVLLNGGTTSFESAINIINITTKQIIRIGFGDNALTSGTPLYTITDHSNGAYFEFCNTTSPNWVLCTSSNSSMTKVTTSTPVASNTWLNLKIAVNDTCTSAEFFINGTSVGAITTNLPSSATALVAPNYKIIKTSTNSGGIEMLVDYTYVKKTFNTPR